MTTIATNFHKIQQQINLAEKNCGRLPGSVQLLAVSKMQSVATIETAIQVGQQAFAENYLQEALTKIATLEKYHLTWHFIGNIQANKTKAIAENFAWVQSVDRLRIAERLSAQRPATLPPLNICLQINIDQEHSKGGVSLAELPALALAIAKLPRLQLRGLMAIPAPQQTVTQQHVTFGKLQNAFQQLQAQGLPLDTLSMGMSDDFAVAIAEGSTMVRIGTALFGKRNSSVMSRDVQSS